MTATQDYGGLIWTNHAITRLGERGLTQEMAWSTVVHSDASRKGKQPGTVEYDKQFGKSKVQVIVSTNKQGEKVVISCWINPPYYGTNDYYKKQSYQRYQKASGWGKVLLIIKEALGF